MFEYVFDDRQLFPFFFQTNIQREFTIKIKIIFSLTSGARANKKNEKMLMKGDGKKEKI